MGEVIILDTPTTLPLPVERVLDAAKCCPEMVVVLGWDEEGEFYFAASQADKREVLWMLEQAKLRLFDRDD